MKTKPRSRFSAVSGILIVMAIFLPGCEHDCQKEKHFLVTAKSGETRCKHCGIYQPTETTSDKKESKE